MHMQQNSHLHVPRESRVPVPERSLKRDKSFWSLAQDKETCGSKQNKVSLTLFRRHSSFELWGLYIAFSNGKIWIFLIFFYIKADDELRPYLI